MRIAILTFHRAYNCGAALQACALAGVLREMGHEVVFPNCNGVGVDLAYFNRTDLCLRPFSSAVRSVVWYLLMNVLSIGTEDVKRSRFRKFIRANLVTTNEAFDDVVRNLDCVIYGSDQIWNPELTRADTALFLGENVPRETPKLSYAASCGDKKQTEGFRNRLIDDLRTFSAISMREEIVGFKCFDSHGRKPTVVVDPTLLAGWRILGKVAAPRRLVSGRYLFVYLALPCPGLIRFAKEVSRAMELKLVVVDVTQRGLWRCQRHVKLACSPDRFLAYVRDAECVLTNSFHGTAISLILRKRFAVLPGSSGGCPHRVLRLLQQIQLTDRIMDVDEMGKRRALQLLRTDIPAAGLRMLEGLSGQSKDWLRTRLSEIIGGYAK